MRLTNLRDSKVKSLDGKTLGRCHEVHVDDGRIVAIECGAGSLIERLTAKAHGRRIPWESVRKVAGGEIIIADKPAPKPKKPSAARSPRGTRQTTGRRSKR